jgi:hypothetical protein
LIPPRSAKRRTEPGRAAVTPALQRAADLAWVGQHEQAVAASSLVIETACADLAAHIGALDLRAESRMALGHLALANEDAQQMIALARTPALEALVRCRMAYVQTRQGDFAAAADTARQAQAAARQARKPWLEALALLRLSEALWCAEDAPDGLGAAEDAAARFERLGDRMWQGRALWSQACALAYLGRNVERERAARRALALAQQTGDHFGMGLAHSILARGRANVAARLQGLHKALAALDAAGYTEPQLEIRLNRLDAARERRSEIAVLEECLAAGMDDYTTKPIRVEALVAALTSANGQSHG